MTTKNNPPELIYGDASLLVVNKPAGLLSVPGRGEEKQDCVAFRLQQHYPDALIVHRLDMATSGLMVFARGMAMQRRLSELFRERIVTKRYIAIVAGKLETEIGEVNLPIAADWPNRPQQKIDAEFGKPSLTRFRVLAHDMNTTRVSLEPVTGRTHQLRVHMKAIGHPILGDALYGDPLNMKAAARFVRPLAHQAGADIDMTDGTPRLLLHAQSLSFPHPASLVPLTFECAPLF